MHRLEQRHCAMMAGAHCNALLSQQVGKVGVVHAFDYKADQRHDVAFLYAYAVAGFQSAQQVVMQGRFMGDHRRQVKGFR